jgi:organic radical activating enzyme
MNDIIKAVQKHEVEVASQAIDKLVEEIHKVLTEKDSDLLESLEEYLSDIVATVKDNLKEESKKAAKAANGKKVKDPNAPKRAPSEYNNFIKDHIASLKEEHPDAKPKELMTMAVAEWRAQKEKMGAAKPAAARKLLSDTEPEDDSDAEMKPEPKKDKGQSSTQAKKGGKK